MQWNQLNKPLLYQYLCVQFSVITMIWSAYMDLKRRKSFFFRSAYFEDDSSNHSMENFSENFKHCLFVEENRTPLPRLSSNHFYRLHLQLLQELVGKHLESPTRRFLTTCSDPDQTHWGTVRKPIQLQSKLILSIFIGVGAIDSPIVTDSLR